MRISRRDVFGKPLSQHCSVFPIHALTFENGCVEGTSSWSRIWITSGRHGRRRAVHAVRLGNNTGASEELITLFGRAFFAESGVHFLLPNSRRRVAALTEILLFGPIAHHAGVSNLCSLFAAFRNCGFLRHGKYSVRGTLP